MSSSVFSSQPLGAELILSAEDFSYFSGLIEELAGIHLAPAKIQLVQGRLRQRVLELGHESFRDYRNYLEGLRSGDPEHEIFVNRLTTNKTEFFREGDHFDFLRDHLLKTKRRSSDTLRVWCAASSTGEEPYTLAIVLSQVMSTPFEILATDIDTEVLAQAQGAVYPVEKLKEVPEEYRAAGFDLGRGEIQHWMRIKPSIRNSVKFQRHNLIESGLPSEQKFDFVFCRNVLIYFTPETCEQIMNKLYQATKPGGMAFIGHSESLQNMKTGWKPLRASVYQKKSGK